MLEQDLARAQKQASESRAPQQTTGREENLIQDMLFTIDSEVSLAPDVQRSWIDETAKLNNSYQYEL
jgi:hypothetical protein